MTRVRVRFAPSPTGFLHVGNARTALVNYIFAKRMGGEFILRIEDTDQDRNISESLDHILYDLKWLKIDWEEGPNIGGKYGPYRQSLRHKHYLDYVDKLIESKMAYPCYCSQDELEHRRKQALENGIAPRYDNRCRDLNSRQKHEYEAQGRVPVWRFKVEPEIMVIDDLIHGEVKFDTSLMGDFVVLRSDNTPTFHLAVCVDDAMMDISHVIRGEDHLSNTPRHILLFKAFGRSAPQYGHLGLVKGKDNKALSKRELTEYFSISGLREKGYLPEAIINCLSNLGTGVDEGKEVMPLGDIIQNFEIDKMGSSVATFDIDKLNWYGGHYIRSADLSRITELTIPYLKNSGLLKGNLDERDYNYLLDVVDVIRHNVSHLSEMAEYAGIFFKEKIDIPNESRQIVNTDKSRVLFNAVIEALLSQHEYITKDTFKGFCDNIFAVTSIKGKDFYHTLRLALTGGHSGPELKDVFLLLGKEKVISRLKDVLENA